MFLDLSDEPDDLPIPDTLEDEDDFTLDPTFLEIVPRTPDLTVTSANSCMDPLPDSSQIVETLRCDNPGDSNKGLGQEIAIAEEPDELSELEAWLNSGAVEIVG